MSDRTITCGVYAPTTHGKLAPVPGRLDFAPSRRRAGVEDGTTVLLLPHPVTVQITDPPQSVALEVPGAGWAWLVRECTPLGYLIRAVTFTAGGALAYADLTETTVADYEEVQWP